MIDASTLDPPSTEDLAGYLDPSPGNDPLAADLRRHLEHQPIAARTPSRAYRLSCMVRRNRGLATGLSVAILILLVGLLVAITFAGAEREQRQRAELRVYQGTMQTVAGKITDARPRDIERLLESAPPELRGWEWNHLRARVYEGESLFEGRVLHLTVDRERAVFLSGERLIGLDLETRRKLLDIPKPDPGAIPLLCGDHFVLEAWLGDISILRVADGEQVGSIRTPRRRGRVQLSPDGQRLVVAHVQGVDVYSLPSGDLLVRREIGPRWHGSFHPDGTRIAVSDEEGTIELRNAQSLELEQTFPTPERAQRPQPFFAPDGRSLVVLVVNDPLRIWDLEQPSSGPRMVGSARRTHYLAELRFGDSGRMTATHGGRIPIWDLGPGEYLGELPGAQDALHPHFALGGAWIVAADDAFQRRSMEGTSLRAWDTSILGTGVLGRHDSYAYSCNSSSPGKRR